LFVFELQYGPRTLHEEPAQIAITALADAEQLLFASGGVLSRN